MQNTFMDCDERGGNNGKVKKMLLKELDIITMTKLKRVIWKEHERHKDCTICKAITEY
jgi:hypothetical protein